ncbi:tetratricopeptide repeat protein [bacterium]|nr:tetratricopeptide repeat protein [bacterium]
MKRIILFIIVILVAGAFSQSYSEYIIQGKEKIQSAVNDWDFKKILDARAYFERALAQGEMDWLIHYYVAYCDYRLTSYMFSKNDMKGAKDYVNDGIKHLKTCIDTNQKFAEAYAMLSSFYGNKIAMLPWAGFYYGPKSGKLMQQATIMGEDNPRVQLQRGLSYYFTPERWGGSKQLAKENFQKATELFQIKSDNLVLPDWGHSETYGWLGSVEIDLGDMDAAKVYFEKALKIDPNNNWVKYQLMPKLKK